MTTPRARCHGYHWVPVWTMGMAVVTAAIVIASQFLEKLEVRSGKVVGLATMRTKGHNSHELISGNPVHWATVQGVSPAVLSSLLWFSAYWARSWLPRVYAAAQGLLLSYAIILNPQSCPELSLFIFLQPSVTYSLIKTANPAVFMLESHYGQERGQLTHGCPLLRLWAVKLFTLIFSPVNGNSGCWGVNVKTTAEKLRTWSWLEQICLWTLTVLLCAWPHSALSAVPPFLFCIMRVVVASICPTIHVLRVLKNGTCLSFFVLVSLPKTLSL